MEKDKKSTIESTVYEYINGVLINRSHTVKEIDGKWDQLDPTCFKKENLGIGLINAFYIETTPEQNKKDEYLKIRAFLKQYLDMVAQRIGILVDDIKLEFINYGKTELVYVLIVNRKEYTLLVKQPATKYGYVKQEADYLTDLKKNDPMVVAPVDYYSNGEYELYMTPYIHQARCVASDNDWGMYVPEPYYRFVEFSDKQRQIVTACMIAKLISLYDFVNNEGIAKCKLGGGDFMLPKGWENEALSYENTLSKLYLIAAREKINCSFEEYIEIIKKEFSKVTIMENSDELAINIRGRVAVSSEDIQAGIDIGKNIITLKNNNQGRKF